ncbi:DUF4436 domain-containing protein [Mycobacterium conspicuum]|jgi:hypothetical protein|uniref:DUF4436 domain-containing protein n=1 Tax=Mycobacterium conspicuum TaxID=44010 RepID=A0A1X1TAL7_9MYCO|nr:DUF4436 domain-containing protein [Mycobacterium conspicuum]ORV41545.1 hypothetical protein AWC00_15205 [Mycobacterium conspicuum]BBZ37637.1 DUF4436 domain-containing protein [Mycobacterium conspicuum]
MRFFIIGLVIFFIGAYIATIALYAKSGCGCPRPLIEDQSAPDGTSVTISLEDLQSVKGALTANVTVQPGAGLLDPQTHGLNADLSVVIHSSVSPSKRTWTAGMTPGVYPVPLTISGDPSNWPFDRYRTGPISVDIIRGGASVAQRVPVNFVDRVPGWLLAVSPVSGGATPALYRVELHRSPSTAAFGAVIVGVLIAIAGVSLFVAVQTLRNKRKFQPPMTTWYAAMLFAVVPLRNALPDSPPIGSWLDVTVTLWVIVVVVMSMLIYISCWWRHLRPEAEKPA